MSVFKRLGRPDASGKPSVRWVAVVEDHRGADGKRKQRKKTFATKRQAQQWERRTRTAIDGGDYIEPSHEPVSVVVAHWLTTADLAANTRRSYAQTARLLIDPAIGTIPLGRLTGKHVQDLYNSVRDSSYGAMVQAIVMGTLRLAVREGLIPRNVADGLKIGRSEQREPTRPAVWSVDELMAFLDGVQDHWLHPLLWTAAHTGLRLSELTALRWEDVSLDLGLLFVGKSKTAAGRRRIALDKGTVDLLRAHQAEQAARRAALADDWHDGGLVFDRGNGQPVAHRTVEAFMKRRAAALGLPPLTPHGLRHCHATMLLENGAPVHVVAQRLGHSSARVTLDFYAHATPGSEREAADRFANLVASAKSCDQMVTNGPQLLDVSAS